MLFLAIYTYGGEAERGRKIRHWIGCDSWPMSSVRIASAFLWAWQTASTVANITRSGVCLRFNSTDAHANTYIQYYFVHEIKNLMLGGLRR